jgi:hypothetical protein
VLRCYSSCAEFPEEASATTGTTTTLDEEEELAISPLPDSNRHMTINDVMAFQNMTGREFHTTTNGTLVLLLLLRNNGILVIIVVGLV